MRPIFLLSILFTFGTLQAQVKTNPKNQDKELGNVSWYRDYDAALQRSQKEKKPVLILFQEVPGCSTCRNYGQNVLSHPLMTEAIENEFIPLAIFNNKDGNDAKVLKKYHEPRWNNPVVRIINEKGENLVPRVASDYSSKGLYLAMEKSLQSYGKSIPTYMQLLGKEVLAIEKSASLDEAYFKMYCFWSGEKTLGSQEGVLATKAGYMNHNEVVRVIFNKKVLSVEQLSQFAQKNKMTPIAKSQFQWS